MTMRRVFSQVAHIFDPIGYAAAFVERAKIGLQRLWDAELSEKCRSEWKKVLQRDGETEQCEFGELSDT